MFQKLPFQKGVTFLDQFTCSFSQTLSQNSKTSNNNCKRSSGSCKKLHSIGITKKTNDTNSTNNTTPSSLINNLIVNSTGDLKRSEPKIKSQRRFSTGVNNFIQKCQRSSSNPIATFQQHNNHSAFNSSNGNVKRAKARYNLSELIANSLYQQQHHSIARKRRDSVASTLLSSSNRHQKQHYSSTTNLFQSIKAKSTNSFQQQHNQSSFRLVVKDSFSRFLKNFNGSKSHNY